MKGNMSTQIMVEHSSAVDGLITDAKVFRANQRPLNVVEQGVLSRGMQLIAKLHDMNRPIGIRGVEEGMIITEKGFEPENQVSIPEKNILVYRPNQ